MTGLRNLVTGSNYACHTLSQP